MSITAVGTGIGVLIGQTLTQEQADLLPVGSRVRDTAGRYITKRAAGSCTNRRTSGWVYEDTNSITPLSHHVNTLVSVPQQEPETLAEFKARFAARVREVTAEYTPTHRRVAERVLADLDGIGVTLGGGDANEGDLAKKGGPDEPGFTVWRYEDGQWVRLYGTAPLSECQRKSASDEAGIDEFRRAAWDHGQQVKQRFKWCSVFDRVMDEFGITDPEPSPDFSHYDVLVKAQEGRDKLPVGSVIGENKGDWGVFVKTSRRHNSADDWTRVCGTRPLAAGTMRLLYMGKGGAGGRVAIRDHGLSAFMPGCEVDGRYIVRLP